MSSLSLHAPTVIDVPPTSQCPVRLQPRHHSVCTHSHAVGAALHVINATQAHAILRVIGSIPQHLLMVVSPACVCKMI